MKSSCISHPKNEQFIVIHQWQTEFCEGNQCAAALLSFFEHQYNWKLDTEVCEQKLNAAVDPLGEDYPCCEMICQSYTLQELSSGMLGLFGRSAIIHALKWLENKNVITVHTHSSSNYFDMTKTYQFNPDICNHWLKKNKPVVTTVDYQKQKPRINEENSMLSFSEIVPQVDEKSKEMIKNITEALMQISKYHFSSTR